MPTRKILPPTYLLISLIAMIVLAFILPAGRFLSPGWNLLGLLPFALGIWLNLSADHAFHKAGTTVHPFMPSSTLVTDGVFQISRNPMYLGFSLLLIGVAVLLNALTPFLVAPAFMIGIDRLYIISEEKKLAGKFGSDWETYRRSVRRWL